MFIARVAEAFNKQKVNYAIAGGTAVALHGAVRGTVDLDVVIRLSKKDFIGAEKALKNLGLAPRLPVQAGEVFDFRQEYIRNKNLIAWSFTNPKNPVEVVDILITEDLAKMKVKKISVAGLKLPVLSLKDLIAMKKRSGRPQDLADIKALEAIQES